MEEESLNFVNGYAKVNPNDHHQSTTQSPPSNRRKAIAVVVTLAFLTLIVAATIFATIVNHPHEKSPQHKPQPPSVKTIESIKTVCAVTPHPDSCFTDISSSIVNTDNNNNNNNNVVVVDDPEVMFNLTLGLAAAELANVSSLPKTLISRSNDLRTGSALRDCATLFDDALSQLTRSVESMAGDGVVMTDQGRLGDLKTWISAAMTDQETCVDGLEEMGSTAVDEVKMRVQRSNVYMSNSLAILANIGSLMEKFGKHLH